MAKEPLTAEVNTENNVSSKAYEQERRPFRGGGRSGGFGGGRGGGGGGYGAGRSGGGGYGAADEIGVAVAAADLETADIKPQKYFIFFFLFLTILFFA